MKIAYVYDAVYPWVTGGVEKRVWEVARRLAPDHEVHLYGWRYWGPEPMIRREGVHLHGVGQPPATLYVDGRRAIPPALSFAGRLVGPVLGERFDVIDCQQFPYFSSFPAKLGALRRGADMVLTWHEVWGRYWYDYLGYRGLAGQLVERTIARLPDRHVAVSNLTRRDVRALGAGSPSLVPNGVSLERIAEVAPADRDVDVLFAGRLIVEKNVGLLVDAVGIIAETEPSVSCVVVGEGPELDALRSRVEALALEGNVSFEGFRESHEEVLALMKAADVFALPSRREGFGMAALEALACGTPVVTVDAPRNAARELVDDGTTGAVCEQTAGDLAAGIVDSRDGASSSACVAAARPYDWDAVVDRLLAVYEGGSG